MCFSYNLVPLIISLLMTFVSVGEFTECLQISPLLSFLCPLCLLCFASLFHFSLFGLRMKHFCCIVLQLSSPLFYVLIFAKFR
jgi:hypothetical protein